MKVEKVRLSSRVEQTTAAIKMDIEGEELEVLAELEKSGKLKTVPVMMIEYHHNIRKDENKFSKLLRILERNGFGYQIGAEQKPPFRPGDYEDIQVWAYKQ